MGNVIFDLMPVVVSATVVPFYIVAVLVLLRSDGGLVKTLGFVAGGVAMRLNAYYSAAICLLSQPPTVSASG